MDNAENRFNYLDISTDGKNIHCLADEEMVSHSYWKNEKEILAWARMNNEDRYYLLKDKANKTKIIAKDILANDGHPSYSPDKRYILTDTYSDRTCHRTLIIYDTKENKLYDIARLFALFKYNGEVRCDLNPRWSRNGKDICFDSVHEGKRQLYIIEDIISKLAKI